MRKQSGFTLIELMVVMAIIAILATSGLTAYTGYLKKARDTTRIAAISTINNVAMGLVSTTGSSPSVAATLTTNMTDANGGIAIVDPRNGVADCIWDWDDTTAAKVNCGYRYIQCDLGTGFSIGTKFESVSNQSMYQTDDNGGTTTTATAGTAATLVEWTSNANTDLLYFEVGSCKDYCQTAGSGCTLVDWTTI